MLYGLGSAIHTALVESQVQNIRFSISGVYVFHTFFSFLLCSVLLALGKYEKWQSQLGFLYLGALILKVVLFSAIFSASLFGQEVLTQTEKLSLLIPVFIFLVPEVYFIAQILSKMDTINK